MGVQLHPTSLPGGRLGPEAYAFADWLAAAGARWWQMLPLNPPDAFGSPYASASAFAGWGGLLADPDARVEPSEARAFLEREAAWALDWAAFAGDGAIVEQVRFEREWNALRAYAARAGRPDHRRRADLRRGRADATTSRTRSSSSRIDVVVAGAPPDDLNELGQLWGNPLYDWPAIEAERYRWWIDRMRRALDARRPLPDRPLPGLRRVLDGRGRRGDRA